MCKTIIRPDAPAAAVPAEGWLDLDRLARVEVTSEDPDHPVEAGRGPG